MNLKDEVFKLIVNDFGSKLSMYEYNQYVIKLRDYLLEYIEKSKFHCKDMEQLFRFEFTRNDIINSTIYYVENNPNVKYKSAIDDFLIALNRLFEEIINKTYTNNPTMEIHFNSLSDTIEREIEKRGIKKLKDRESFPAIKDKEYDLLVEYLKNMKCNKITNYQCKIIVSLLLLYGFSFDKIIDINLQDYSTTRGILTIYFDKRESYMNLELPYNLKILMNEFIEIRKTFKKSGDSLFITTSGNKIAYGYLSAFFKKVKKTQNIKQNGARNPLTPTGLAKYAVINMILEGMNQSIILDLTGFKLDHYLDCQNEVNNLKNLNLNRYVNRVIRGIKTFDDINNY